MALSGAVAGGISLGLFMAISVGPTLFAVIRYSLNHSYKAGLAFVLGVSVSDFMYVALANLATPFLEELRNFETEIAYGGGALLVAMGFIGLVKKFKPQRPRKELVVLSRSKYFQIWGSGFLINTINPGVIINWLGAVTILATQGATLLYRGVFFGCCLIVVLGIDFLKVLLADSIRKKLTLRLMMHLQRISAAIIMLFGLAILAITFFDITIAGETLGG